MIQTVYISNIIIKNFPQIDLKFACYFFFVFSCTEFECTSVKTGFAEIENSS